MDSAARRVCQEAAREQGAGARIWRGRTRPEVADACVPARGNTCAPAALAFCGVSFLRAAASLRMAAPTSHGRDDVLKFIGGTIGVIFLIGLLVVIGLLALIF